MIMEDDNMLNMLVIRENSVRVVGEVLALVKPRKHEDLSSTPPLEIHHTRQGSDGQVGTGGSPGLTDQLV